MSELARSGLVWGVRRSFVDYVYGTGGGVEIGEGAGTIGTGEYYFKLADASGFDAGTGRGTVRFRGSVRFHGHHGLMSVEIADPSVSFGERTTAFCELAYPHRVRWPILGRMIEMSFDKRQLTAAESTNDLDRS